MAVTTYGIKYGVTAARRRVAGGIEYTLRGRPLNRYDLLTGQLLGSTVMRGTGKFLLFGFDENATFFKPLKIKTYDSFPANKIWPKNSANIDKKEEPKEKKKEREATNLDQSIRNAVYAMKCEDTPKNRALLVEYMKTNFSRFFQNDTEQNFDNLSDSAKAEKISYMVNKQYEVLITLGTQADIVQAPSRFSSAEEAMNDKKIIERLNQIIDTDNREAIKNIVRKQTFPVERDTLLNKIDRYDRI